MPHTAMNELGGLARSFAAACVLVNDLQLEMATDPVLRKTLADSVLTVETNAQGTLTLVLDFAPGIVKDSPGMDKVRAFLTKDKFFIDMKEHRAGGKYHSVYEMKVKHRGVTLKSECFCVRVTLPGGTASIKTDRIEDGGKERDPIA